jgi:hypothetical protein
LTWETTFTGTVVNMRHWRVCVANKRGFSRASTVGASHGTCRRRIPKDETRDVEEDAEVEQTKAQSQAEAQWCPRHVVSVSQPHDFGVDFNVFVVVQARGCCDDARPTSGG